MLMLRSRLQFAQSFVSIGYGISRQIATLLIAVIVFGAACPDRSLAVTTYPLNQQDPTSFSTGGLFGNTGWGRGWEFTVSGIDVYVTELGAYTFDTGTSPVDIVLWNVSSQTALASATTAVGAGWQFSSISPVALANGGSYAVIVYDAGNPAQYYFANPAPASWKPTGTINYVTMRYCNGCGVTNFPTSTISNTQYGMVDIGYQIGAPTEVPIPATLPLFSSALGVVGLIARRRKRKANLAT